MNVSNLNEMVGGWFVGNFSPSVLTSDEFEVAIKKYAAGDSEPKHVHKVATEITVIVSGRVRMFGTEFSEGAIITLAPGDATAFLAIEDTITVVVKSPSVSGDKYLC